MRLSRRDALRLLGLGALTLPLAGVAGCGAGPRSSSPRVLASATPLPPPFRVPLPLPPVLAPTGRDADTDYYEMTARAADTTILPGLPTTVWGYEGGFPGPTLHARRGRRVVLRQRNELPVPIVTHLHGGRTPPDSDGYPTDLILPAGRRFVSHMHDPAAEPTGVERRYEFPFDQGAATLWYHDHRMDFTGPQVWRGLAGFCVVHDEVDDALPLPKGDKDVPLMICDRSFAVDGQFAYPSLDETLREVPGVLPDYGGGVLGDVVLVNGAPWPRMEVANTRYRLRLLNGSNARRYELALDPGPATRAPFLQIASDGGLLAAPVARDTITLAPAERVEVVVDFAGYRVDDVITLRNEADDGPAGQVMQFAVTRTEHDDSAVPGRLGDVERLDPAAATRTREFSFGSGQVREHAGWLINGQPFDPVRMDASAALDSTEIWRITTDVAHPVHLHLVQFQVLSVNDRPPPVSAAGWKDTIDLDAAQTAEIIMRFSGHRGRYVFHCHNLEHEDMAMMANFEVV